LRRLDGLGLGHVVAGHRCIFHDRELHRTFYSPVPGSLADIGAAADGTVWGVNASGKIYRYAGDQNDKNHWPEIPGNLTRIAAGSRTNVWGVNSGGNIYSFSGFDTRASSPWNQITGSLADIGAAADGTVWGVNAAGNIYCYTGDRQD
ncbi:tectonin domain-containing protein, partial [Streptomyces microflavus]|uniref:tectonin domain-containing protein n=1 Tax=Streptomyces microflavus TaxID=1919 RepID=UPI003412D436